MLPSTVCERSLKHTEKITHMVSGVLILIFTVIIFLTERFQLSSLEQSLNMLKNWKQHPFFPPSKQKLSVLRKV